MALDLGLVDQAVEAKDLGDVGEVEVAVELGGDADVAGLDASMALVDGLSAEGGCSQGSVAMSWRRVGWLSLAMKT